MTDIIAQTADEVGSGFLQTAGLILHVQGKINTVAHFGPQNCA